MNYTDTDYLIWNHTDTDYTDTDMVSIYSNNRYRRNKSATDYWSSPKVNAWANIKTYKTSPDSLKLLSHRKMHELLLLLCT